MGRKRSESDTNRHKRDERRGAESWSGTELDRTRKIAQNKAHTTDLNRTDHSNWCLSEATQPPFWVP